MVLLSNSRHDVSRNSLDEDLVAVSQQGCHRSVEILLGRYRHLVESKARTFYLVGADHDDVVQEGLIGLYKAIRDYQFNKHTRFRAFAELCVTRQIITAIKMSTRQKHAPMNTYVSLQQSISDLDGDASLLECIPDEQAPNPEAILIQNRERADLHHTIEHKLSPLESKVLYYYLRGNSYKEMSETMKCRTKCIDNALQRIKRKIGNIVELTPGA